MWIAIGIFLLFLALVVIYDVVQKKHAILRNYPILGHFRYLFEAVGPELRQYVVTNNDEERPFSRDQRRWVYSSSKQENSYFGFGSDNEMERASNYLIIKHDAFPLSLPRPGDAKYDPDFKLPCAKVLGGHRQRKKAFRPESIVNVSAMSFGSLSGAAVEALNRGCAIAGCMHNTGEGSVSPHHLHGGELIYQIGTGYFGCRDADGRFSLPKVVEMVERHPQIRAIEIKLSQGGKAGLGGIVPGKKVTAEIAKIRGIPIGEDCLSPAGHTAFGDADSLLDFVENLADQTGLPVGIKSAVGEIEFWQKLADLIDASGRSVDFITIDGGEGGTGAAPLAFADHVALPFKVGFTRVYREFALRGLHEKIVFAGASKLGFPETAIFAVACGCDFVYVAREAMMSIGCIQAQRCHTGHCPTGITTHNRWLVRGLDPTLKSARLANYIVTLRKELTKLSFACGVCHPAMVNSHHTEILDGRYGAQSIEEVFNYRKGWGLPSEEDRQGICDMMGYPMSGIHKKAAT